MTSYVVVGAGAVGGAIGGGLALAGHHVTLVARGAHLDALRARGLTLVMPRETHVLRLPVTASVGDVALRDRIVIVATKSQDTAAALAPIAERNVSIVCAQNGVANERLASERFDEVLGLVVFAPLAHLEPGVVRIHSKTTLGGLELGLWPTGTSPRAEEIVRDLAGAGFDARATADIRAWKYGKLLSNLGNVLEAIGGRAALKRPWLAPLIGEAERCLAASGEHWVSLDDLRARFANVDDDGERGGGSTWQSLARGTPLETDALNGEIVRMGHALGIPTPANEAMVALARRAETEHWAPGDHIEEITLALAGT